MQGAVTNSLEFVIVLFLLILMQQNTEKYVLLLTSTARQRNAFLSLGIQNRANLILRIKI